MSDAEILSYVHAAYAIAALILGGITLTTIVNSVRLKRKERLNTEHTEGGRL